MIGRAAIQYSAVLYNAILYNGWQYNAILYNTMPPLLFDLVYYYDNSIKHIAILCSTMQYDWTGRNTIQCSAIQCYTIQWMAILYNTMPLGDPFLMLKYSWEYSIGRDL